MQVSVSGTVPTRALVVVAQPQRLSARGAVTAHTRTVQLRAQTSHSISMQTPLTPVISHWAASCSDRAGKWQACAQGEVGPGLEPHPLLSTARLRCLRAWRWTSTCWAS